MSENKPKPMTPKAGVTKDPKRRYMNGGKVKQKSIQN